MPVGNGAARTAVSLLDKPPGKKASERIAEPVPAPGLATLAGVRLFNPP